MAKISTFAKNEMIDHVFKAAYTPIATLYLCLCTADPTVAGTGASIVETDYAGYIRLAFTGATKFAASTARKIVQDAIFTFAQATGVSTSDISDWAVCDAAANGNMLAFGTFGTNFNVVSGNTPKIAAGQIEIEMDANVDGTGFTTSAADLLLDHVFANDIWATPSAAIHFGLTTVTMSDASTLATITEANATGYAREPVPASSFDAASSASNTTGVQVDFDIPTGDQTGDITSLFVCDALSGTAGILISYDNTNVVDQPFNTNDEVVVEAGSFSVTLN